MKKTDKEKLDNLKKCDPIKYYEMIDDPTHPGSDNLGCGIPKVILVFIIMTGLLILLNLVI